LRGLPPVRLVRARGAARSARRRSAADPRAGARASQPPRHLDDARRDGQAGRQRRRDREDRRLRARAALRPRRDVPARAGRRPARPLQSRDRPAHADGGPPAHPRSDQGLPARGRDPRPLPSGLARDGVRAEDRRNGRAADGPDRSAGPHQRRPQHDRVRAGRSGEGGALPAVRDEPFAAVGRVDAARSALLPAAHRRAVWARLQESLPDHHHAVHRRVLVRRALGEEDVRPHRPSRRTAGSVRHLQPVLSRRSRSDAPGAAPRVGVLRAVMNTHLLRLLAACAIAAAGTTAAARQRPADADRKEWIQLFNGRDLSDWTIKFAHHDLGENYNDTFRVEDGLLKVRYDKWTEWHGEFGHIFYKQPFSYYLLAAEYRFVGDQLAPAAAINLNWAKRNNGLMLHCLDPKTMMKDQDFPISIEVQLLGGLSDGKPRPTANLCTPGTNVVMNGALHTPHCTNSTSKTYDGDQWVRVEVLVHGDELIRHMIDGQSVIEYSKPQIGGAGASPTDPKVKVDGTILSGGFI